MSKRQAIRALKKSAADIKKAPNGIMDVNWLIDLISTVQRTFGENSEQHKMSLVFKGKTVNNESKEFISDFLNRCVGHVNRFGVHGEQKTNVLSNWSNARLWSVISVTALFLFLGGIAIERIFPNEINVPAINRNQTPSDTAN